MKELKIIFMGTPEFAVPSLSILIENKFNIVAVITAPDKPQGRGKMVGESSVKIRARELGIRILQPTNLKAPEFIEQLKALQADLQVVVAFRMLPEAVWSMPAKGTINLHASLLPQYRGAAPINWAIINGEKETGITTFFLKQEIDTGNILFQEKEPIHDDDNAGTLYERLKTKGAQLVLKTVKAIASGAATSTEQSPIGDTKPAPKIFRESCQVNWNQPAERVLNFIRGLSPSPGAWTVVDGKSFKILRAKKVNLADPGTAGWKTDNKNYLYFRTSDGWTSVEELQAEGKKRMTIGEYFRGNELRSKG